MNDQIRSQETKKLDDDMLEQVSGGTNSPNNPPWKNPYCASERLGEEQRSKTGEILNRFTPKINR